MGVHFCGVATGKGTKNLRKLSKKCSNFVSYHSVDVIVFDGYAPSTKVRTHQKRSGTVFETVQIKNDNPYIRPIYVFLQLY